MAGAAIVTPHFHRLTVTDVRRETPEAVSVAFDVPDALKREFGFAPGQYLTLKATIDGEEVRRSYSICSGIDDGELRVAIKRLDGGLFSTYANESLRPGDALDVMTPMGRFTVDVDPTARRTFVGFASGSGITPILSIIKTVLIREPHSRFFLIYGNRAMGSIIFREALDDLKDRFLDRLSVFHVLSREAQDISILNGRLDGEKVALLMKTIVPAKTVDHAFVCGPAGMLDEIEQTLLSLGLPREHVHVERFTPAPDHRPQPKRPAAITAQPKALATLVLDGIRTEVPVVEGESVIDAALRAGLDLPYSCRGGMCCTCRAKLVEGKVEMALNYSLEQWELDAGFVLTCQAQPKTARVVIDYDQV